MGAKTTDLRMLLIGEIMKIVHGSWRPFQGFVIRENNVIIDHEAKLVGENKLEISPRELTGVHVRRDLVRVELELRKSDPRTISDYDEPMVNLHVEERFETPYGPLA